MQVDFEESEEHLHATLVLKPENFGEAMRLGLLSGELCDNHVPVVLSTSPAPYMKVAVSEVPHYGD